MTAQAIADKAPWSFAKPAPTGDEYDWRDDALCAQVDPEIFFPPKGGSSEDAKKVCTQCDVREQCLQYAIDNDEALGVWGGLTRPQRNHLKSDEAPVEVKPRKKYDKNAPRMAERDAQIVSLREKKTPTKVIAAQFSMTPANVSRVIATANRRARERAEESPS